MANNISTGYNITSLDVKVVNDLVSKYGNIYNYIVCVTAIILVLFVNRF